MPTALSGAFLMAGTSPEAFLRLMQSKVEWRAAVFGLYRLKDSQRASPALPFEKP